MYKKALKSCQSILKYTLIALLCFWCSLIIHFNGKIHSSCFTTSAHYRSSVKSFFFFLQMILLKVKCVFLSQEKTKLELNEIIAHLPVFSTFLMFKNNSTLVILFQNQSLQRAKIKEYQMEEVIP